ncbi:Alpha/beta hydrolase fold-3 domain-containing protein [Penicillium ucsense]|uniref:Alpha/beta hydrolase fold-3 domain-containing protein n=1 Tax=Penicillium ucsense TaxID=2839758 RepID=A0A8J8W6M2_9EURO|nr:Alpha/beta hydrolase fold-3 domain-containing protein [Penicillium ucsense]KAF7737872.1 Alpha/beta hydrolase fold-3 domain-containing protein [Penicillium ucsense]
MAQESSISEDDPALHNWRSPLIFQPLHNSIPPELLLRFDPIFVEYYNKYNAGRLHTHEVPIDDFRRSPARYMISYGRANGPDVYSISEEKCPVSGGEITIRIFEPAPQVDAQDQPKKRAAYINFHGGGWVFGGLDYDHDFCKRLVHGLDGDLVAFDVDYRLAPEHPYPVPVDDCWAAFTWIRSHKADVYNLDVNRFAIGGASAGGHLSAVLAHLCRDENIPLRLQVLTVPICDLDSSFTFDGHFDRQNSPYPSYREMEVAPLLPVARMEFFYRYFLGVPRPAPSAKDWKISPMLAPNFNNLAPALVSTAEMDPLRDEGEAYADKLLAAGNRVEKHRYLGAPHTFAGLDGILEAGRQYNERVIACMKRELRV